jgi:hypothetical protein
MPYAVMNLRIELAILFIGHAKILIAITNSFGFQTSDTCNTGCRHFELGDAPHIVHKQWTYVVDNPVGSS